MLPLFQCVACINCATFACVYRLKQMGKKKDVNMTLSVGLNTLLINSFDMNISAVIAPQIYKFFQENL